MQASMYYTLDWDTRHSSVDWASLPPTRIAIPRLDVGLLPALPHEGRDDLLSREFLSKLKPRKQIYTE